MNSVFNVMLSRKAKITTGVFTLVAILSACVDTIDPDLESASPVISIDAWLTDKSEPQVIHVTWTVAYDENEKLPPGVSGCNVMVTDNLGNEYLFSEDTQANNGSYIWQPSLGSSLVKVERSYTLQVSLPDNLTHNPEYNRAVFQATSVAGDVPPVDSIKFTYDDDSPFFAEGYSAEFWARDLPGSGNTYWIRTYKNAVFLGNPGDLNIAYDAGTSKDENFDGATFILPIRLGINPQDEDEDEEELPPYGRGDEIYVEINSVTREAFDYLTQVIANTDRQTGIGGLFSTPLTNVSTNLKRTDEYSEVVGFFNVGTVKGRGASND
jgi:hypothetical protein